MRVHMGSFGPLVLLLEGRVGKREGQRKITFNGTGMVINLFYFAPSLKIKYTVWRKLY